MNRVSGIYEVKDLSFTSLKSQGRGEMDQCRKKIFEEIMAKNFPNLIEDINLQILNVQ